MYHYKFPNPSVNYSLSMVKEVWTTFYQGTTLETADYQVQKVLPYMPIIAVTPPDQLAPVEAYVYVAVQEAPLKPRTYT